jgi:hypothetical protein
MSRLDDGVGEGGFDEGFFDVAFAVVVHEFAELGMEDGTIDEMLEVGFAKGECGFDHILPNGVSILC